MDVYVGVDWSASEGVCSVGIGDATPRRFREGVKRTLPAVRALLEHVRELAPPGATIHVVIEAGAPGWVMLFHYSGAVVHVVDPQQASAFAKSLCSSGAKDDRRDSATLVEMGRSPRHLPDPWKPREELYARLEILGSLHESATADSTAAQQRLRGVLREQMPAVEAVMKDLTVGWVAKLLRAMPTAWHASKLTAADVRHMLEGSGARETTRVAVIAAVEATVAPWITPAVAQTLALQVEYLLSRVEQLHEQVGRIEAELDALTSTMELRKTLESVGGIAMKTANRLIQYAFEDEPEHRDQASILLGASPVFRGSAKDKSGKAKGHAAMRRAVPARARATAYLLGRQAALELRWAAAMYADGRSRGQSAGTAYRRIARSLLRILTALRRTGERYDDTRYIESLQAKGVAWAQELKAA